jgi:hypothetical protein
MKKNPIQFDFDFDFKFKKQEKSNRTKPNRFPSK